MAEPAEGVYVVLCVGSSKAMDVKGDKDASGTNVFQCTRDNTEGQFWSFDKQSNGWQIICSLTGKALDVKGAKFAAGTNIQQYSDNNKASQRWTVATDGKSFTYNGTSYPSYTIKSKSNANLAVGIRGNSSANYANVELATASTSNYQRWILIPAPVFRNNGTYEIVLAADPKMCVAVSSGSTANSANIIVWNRTGSSAQIFRAAVDEQTGLTTFYNHGSGKVLDIRGNESTIKAGSNVIQYTYNGGSNQRWLPVKSGSVKINKVSNPTYLLHAQVGTNLVLDCQGGGKKAKTNIEVWTNKSAVNQRFAFVKAEATDPNIAVPGGIQQTLFTRTGPGKITISGLTFRTGKTMFQSRYRIRYYKKDGSIHKTSAWMSTKDNSTAREGWSDAWSYTFKATPKLGIVTIPFKKTIELTSTNAVSADIFFEVRTYVDDYKGFKVHSSVKSSTVKVRQKPTLTLSSAAFYVGNNTVGVRTTIKNSLENGCVRLRGRLKGSDGRPISDWVDTSVLTQDFPLGTKLRRLPNDNEKLTYEYTIILKDNITMNQTKTANFQFKNGAASLSPSVNFIENGSCSLEITSPKHKYDCCVMEISDVEGKKFILCPQKSETNTTRTWKCIPPLNKSVKITVYGYRSNTAWYYGVKTVKIKSHSFIWNWTTSSSKPYEEFATILFNEDAPPQQTRQYSSNLSYQSPAGRVWPVGFATNALTLDVSVEGTIVDPNANYHAMGPLPARGAIENIRNLISLAGKGIHPIYRTPYGDYYQVGIEQVNVSRNDMWISKATVTQHALED